MRKPQVESMVDTRASSRNLGDSDPQSESIALLAAPDAAGPSSSRTPQDNRLDLADEAEILEERLKALQHEERIARLKRKVSEWEGRRDSGFPNEPTDLPIRNRVASVAQPQTSSEDDAASQAFYPDEDDAESSQPAGKRRQPSSNVGRDMHTHFPDPSRYRAHNFREYTAYIRSCENRFDSRPQEFATDESRALYVRAWSEGDTQNAIYRYLQNTEKTSTWDDLKKFLLGLLAPKAQRRQDAARAYFTAKQRRDQNVNAFITYLEGLEENLPPSTNASRVAHLAQALRLDISVEIMTQGTEPTEYNDLVAAAERAEQIVRIRSGALREDRQPQQSAHIEPNAKPYRAANSTSRLEGRFRPTRTWTAPSTQARLSTTNRTPINPRPVVSPKTAYTPRDKSKDSCRSCGKLGHWEKDCWKKNGGKPQGKA